MGDETIALAKLVQAMRHAQAMFFKLRNQKTLDESKRLEREVDHMVKSILNPQRSLFDD